MRILGCSCGLLFFIFSHQPDILLSHCSNSSFIIFFQSFLTDREQLQAQNSQLQHKLADYFRKKKADERQDYDKNLTDQEQRYLKYMGMLEAVKQF